MKDIDTIILTKVYRFRPKGEINHTIKLFLSLLSMMHKTTKEHLMRVALLAEATAEKSNKDSKAAFLGGLLHDFGKLMLPHHLFDGHEISSEEYDKIKNHSLMGFKVLKEFHLFSALCAGLHHNLYVNGYGIGMNDFPKDWPPALVKKVLEISTIISICDFIDAYNTRGTKIKDGSGGELKELLYEKYPNDQNIVDTALILIEKDYLKNLYSSIIVDERTRECKIFGKCGLIERCAEGENCHVRNCVAIGYSYKGCGRRIGYIMKEEIKNLKPGNYYFDMCFDCRQSTHDVRLRETFKDE